MDDRGARHRKPPKEVLGGFWRFWEVFERFWEVFRKMRETRSNRVERL